MNIKQKLTWAFAVIACLPVVLVANKAEGKAGDAGAFEAYSLGLGEPLRLSAEHGEGMDDLYRALKPLEGEFAEREAENAPVVDVDLSEDEAELEVVRAEHAAEAVGRGGPTDAPAGGLGATPQRQRGQSLHTRLSAAGV